MYEAFYGLSEKPFNLTPDPRFLCLSEKHKEAFSHLLYGIMSRSGFIMISGEIGTGKTTICRYLLSKLDLDTEVAFVFNPTLSPEELLRTINQDFGSDTKAASIKGLIDELNVYLLDRYAQGKNCVLVIDEAQDLEPRVLEQIRLLSNLETETAKLLQIILIGQPELAEMLELPELRQLNQRITARYHLQPLNREETMQYIAYRLRVAGARNIVKFSKGALNEIYRFSKGTPRVINAVCDRALLIGFTQELREFETPIIRQAIHEIRGEWVENKRKRRAHRRALYPVLAAAAAIALVAGSPLAASWIQHQKAADAAEGASTSASGRLDSVLDSMLNPGDRSGDAVADEDRAVAVLETALSLVQEKSRELAPAPRAEGSKAYAAVRNESGLPPSVEMVDPADVDVSVGTAETTAGIASGPMDPESPMAQALATILQVHKEQRQANRMALDEAMSGVDPAAAFDAGVGQLLALWDKEAPAPVSPHGAVESIREVAAASGLACEVLDEDLDRLAAINLPAMVEIRAADGPRWMSLLNVRDDELRVSHLDGTSITVSREDFTAHYTGKCAIFWQDPSPTAEMIRPNSSSPAVRALQLQLKALGRYEGAITTTYDASVAEVVRAIQEETGINTDGIVGRQTRMVLSSWLPSSPTPWLRAGGAYTVGELAMAVRSDAATADRSGNTAVPSTAAAVAAPSDAGDAASEPGPMPDRAPVTEE